MLNRAAAMRYAGALLAVSHKDSDPERVEREVSDFVGLLAAHPRLASSLVNPGIPSARKQALMKELVVRMGEVSPVTRRLLMLLADRDRLSLLEGILSEYRDRLMALRGIVRARITTSAELPATRVQAIAKMIEDAIGKQVEIETGVDAALLGGMVTQIGSTVYDGSIAGHLARLRRRFLSEA